MVEEGRGLCHVASPIELEAPSALKGERRLSLQIKVGPVPRLRQETKSFGRTCEHTRVRSQECAKIE